MGTVPTFNSSNSQKKSAIESAVDPICSILSNVKILINNVSLDWPDLSPDS